jgi:hypothetical protein
MELTHDRPWATVYRVPTSEGIVWFKACRPVQAFEPRLTAELSKRWQDRVARVLAHDVDRDWILMADAGAPLARLGNDPELWLRALPAYAEMQIGEMPYAAEHRAHGVPDLRGEALPARFEELLGRDLPLDPEEVARLRRFAPRFPSLCGELIEAFPVESVQHDDLHLWNVYADGPSLRFLDWGDASIGHPFASLVVTFRFLEEVNGLRPDDPWFDRLRDAYLEPWGRGLATTFALAMRVGAFAHAIASMRQRDALPPAARVGFDEDWAVSLRRALP